MSYETISHYRMLEYDRPGNQKTDPQAPAPAFGGDWPTGEPGEPRPSLIGRAFKVVVFLVAVGALCALFFKAGEWISDHLITRSSAALGVRAASTPPAPPDSAQAATQVASTSSAAPAPTEKAPEASQPSQPPVAVAPKQEPSRASSTMHGTIVLQVAALTRQSDASIMAGKLQQKQYPAFVRLPTTDNFYRVQVGPYPDLQSANAVKRSLEHDGYEVIIKH